MIINLDKEIKGWYNEGESINKMMLGGWRIFQKFSPDTDPKGEYRWVVVPDDYICSGTTKMEKLKKQVTYDGGNWQDVVPPIYKAGDVIEYNSEDCGYIPPQYRWVNLNPLLEYVCVGVDKYYKQQKQVSWDGGVSWENVEPSEYRTGDLYQADSQDCGYIPPQYRDVSGTPYCVNYDKMVDVEHQVSYDGGETWTTTATTTDLVERYSEDCGYVRAKILATNSFGNTKIVPCDSSKSIRDTDVEELLDGFSPRSIIIGTSDCVNKVGQYAFDSKATSASIHIGPFISELSNRAFENSSTNITFDEGLKIIGEGAFLSTRAGGYTMTLPSTITYIGADAFASPSRNTIILTGLNPPSTSNHAFLSIDGSKFNIVKVPCESLFKYQRAWYSYHNGSIYLINNIYPSDDSCWDSTGNKCTFTYKRDGNTYTSAVANNNVTILDDGQINASKSGSGTTNESISITNKPMGIIGVQFNEVSIAADNKIVEITNSFSGSTFENNEVPNLDHLETVTYSFRGCSFSGDVSLPSIKQIGAYAFTSCRNITSLHLGSGLTSINLDALKYCASLSTVTCEAVTPPSIGNYVFTGAPLTAIYVPSASVDAYKAAANWSNFANIIQPIP